MADGTAIEWTDATWNPITGCSVVSPGCKFCYAMKLAGTRLKHTPSRQGLTVDTKAGPVWNGQVRFNREWLHQPIDWKRPRRIFVCAHGDLFAENVPDEWILDVFTVMAIADQHTFQVLTKRPDRARDFLSERFRLDDIYANWYGFTGKPAEVQSWPLHNVWIGASAEDQQRYDDRRRHLDATLAAKRFWSLEPLLGPVSLKIGHVKPDWVIVGGESGPKARPMLAEWARSIRDQCAAAARGGEAGTAEQGSKKGVPFFFKQWGEWIDADEWLGTIESGGSKFRVAGEDWPPARPLNFENAALLARLTSRKTFEHQSDGTTLIRVGKKAAGRRLDGIEHNAFPGAC